MSLETKAKLACLYAGVIWGLFWIPLRALAEAGILSARHQGAGGSVTAYARLEGSQQDRFREVLITGDFFVAPPRTIFDLEAALRGTFTKDIQQTVAAFFESADIGLMTVSADDFTAALEQAVAAK